MTTKNKVTPFSEGGPSLHKPALCRDSPLLSHWAALTQRSIPTEKSKYSHTHQKYANSK